MHVVGSVIVARLDASMGPFGWSLDLRPWGGSGIVACLRLGATERSACLHVVEDRAWPLEPSPDRAEIDASTMHSSGVGPTVPVRARGTEPATDIALWMAARMWGASHVVGIVGDDWVDCDPDDGTPLYFPEVHLAAGGADAQEGAGAGASGDAHDRAPVAGEQGADRDDDTDKPEGRRMIDRLVERLGDAGFGAHAARLVMQHGGYGADAEASRELYAELRALWVQYAGATTASSGSSLGPASPGPASLGPGDAALDAVSDTADVRGSR